jgi:hypothetical protein
MDQIPPDVLLDLVAGLRVAERSITRLIEELAAARDDASVQRDMVVRMQEQLNTTRDTMRTIEHLVRGDGSSDGLTHAVIDLRRAETAMRDALAKIYSDSIERETAGVHARGYNTQAIATIVAALLGAASGIISLIITMRH